MEEGVQTLVDDKCLHGQRGNYRLTQGMMNLRIPPTAHGVLAARIDRLAPAEKTLLQQLAVIGRECPLALVRQVIPDAQGDVYQRLTTLQDKEFLFEQPGFPDVKYVFKHALTHEVAYNSMLIERRKVLHQQTAEAIEQLFHQQLEAQYTALAHHYSNSGNTEKAIQYILKDFRTAWFAATLQEFDTSA